MRQKLALRSPCLLLACKSLLLGVVAGSALSGSLLLKSLFFLVSILFFFFPTIQTLPYFWSWLFLLFLVFFNRSLPLSDFFTPLSFTFFFALLSFIHLGSKDIIFIRHKEIHVILSLFFVFLSIYFFISTSSFSYFLLKVILLFLSSFFLLREFLYGFLGNLRSRIISLVLALVTTELALIVSWLPLTSLRSTLLIFAPLLFFLHLLTKEDEKKPNQKKVLSLSLDFTVFFLIFSGILLSALLFS